MLCSVSPGVDMLPPDAFSNNWKDKFHEWIGKTKSTKDAKQKKKQARDEIFKA